MNIFYTVKHYLKLGRWQARRAVVALRWSPSALSGAPAVLGNAMPKSGSHLIIQVLQGLTRIGPFVNPGFPPVNRNEENATLPADAIMANLRRMRPGDIAYGYLGYQEPFRNLLTAPGRAIVFVYRDPRDMLVSHVFYATDIHKGHGMHRYYTEKLHTMEERLTAAIRGIEDPNSSLPSVRTRYEHYLGWLKESAALCLRFEDLILDRDAALNRLLDYLERYGFVSRLPRGYVVGVLKQAIVPKKSGTFRKGQPGNWREHFTEANKALFKELAGDLLIRLGYEKDSNW